MMIIVLGLLVLFPVSIVADMMGVIMVRLWKMWGAS